ncbi:6-phosphogluconolactonase [Alginatibacterium sediminis]|uniref:6-phosphogluconolactonase n=1 Tax=Alginatibacterium sediminis TaxID=2164068 RepID=A0A420E846_9ALTE|nr:6-phosphogluconolactonase [Alginatibacterium sediminis]RKF15563.1 6-phosphogluconolactonase [Alginatibacterium sediminis]
MSLNYQRFDTAMLLIEQLTKELIAYSKLQRPVHISLSGGSTPKRWFTHLAQDSVAQSIDWNNLHFWWGDERMVDPTDEQSNFGDVNQILFQHVPLPSSNIHRIQGENEPEFEAKRFKDEMLSHIPLRDGMPVFDWIILGMGEDGHTASLFPYQGTMDAPGITLVAKHPESGQIRVTKTAALLEQAQRITYLVIGKSKAGILKEIQSQAADSLPYPAAKVKSLRGETQWYLDKDAAIELV